MYVQKLPPTPFSALDHLFQTPLLVPSQHVLLHPRDRPPDGRAQHAQRRRQQLQHQHQAREDPKRAEQPDQLVGLVQVILRFDQVFGLAGSTGTLGHEVQNGDEGEVGGEKGKCPDAYELVDGDVEDEVLSIVGCSKSFVLDYICRPDGVTDRKATMKKEGEGEQRTFGAKEQKSPTDAIDGQFDPWADHLVPAVNAPYQPSRAVEAARPADGMDEGRRRSEVFLESRALLRRRGLAEYVDDAGDFGDWRE